ncbi:MAG: mechanosensitive ion channel family protein [Planctomycetota bacterium]|nr:MAG: mechanosensitive ion channel family protein [Planctomycetota bacterium]
MEWIQNLLKTKYVIQGLDLELSAFQVIGALLSLVLGFAIGKIASYFMGHKFKSWAEKTKSKADDYIAETAGKPLSLLFQVTGIYIALKILGLPEKPYNFDQIANNIFHIFLAIDITWFLSKFVDALQIHLNIKAEEAKIGLDKQIIRLISKTLKAFIWIISAVLILQNLGYSISGLLAGLGIGGLAVAMAAKDTLANLFGSITVFLDRPFKIGDIVTVESCTGTVEEIGFRSTRIRTFEDTLITIPNQKLTNAEVENISKRHWRKVRTVIGVTYETTMEQMKQIILDIKQVLDGHSKILDDHIVTFQNFGDSALEIGLIYKIQTDSYREYLEVQHFVNFEIMKVVEKNGSEFAFPSRTVYLKQENPEAPAPAEKSKNKKKK